MLIKYLLFFLLIFLAIEIYYDYIFKQTLVKDFPKNILPPLDESIKLPNIEKSKIIPKKIYRTYYDLELAKKFNKANQMTKINNEELNEIIFDDIMIEEYIKNNYSNRIYKAYKSIDNDYGPAKADFFRYLIIYKEGGIYLDIKSVIIKNIDEELKESKLIVSKGRYNPYPIHYGLLFQYLNKYNWSYFSGVEKYGEYNNWHIISPKGNEILGKVIKQTVSNIEYGLKNKDKYTNGEYSVLALTGPIMFSRVIDKYKNKENILIKNTNLNGKVKYSLYDIDHKNIGYKKHYSKLENKKILIN